MRTFILASTIALLGLSSTAQAHFVLESPLPTNPVDSMPPNTSDPASGKGGLPCGPDMMAAATPTAAQGGHTILLKLLETVPHDGFYRVALSINSRSEIPPDNVVYDANNKVLSPDGPAGTSNRADTEDPAVFPVLADNLFPHMGTGMMTFMANIMLPNVNCDHCTMQVIEFMHPHGYNGTPGKNNGGGYFYHHCADLKITADPAMPIFTPGTDGGVPDASTSTDGSGGTSGTGAAGTSGAAGTGGTGGTSAAGTAGSGSTGSGGGAAGTTATGTAGTTGAAGSTATTGAAGTTAGTGGSTGGSGGSHSSGGGCSVSPKGTEELAIGAPLILIALVASRRAKSSRRR